MKEQLLKTLGKLSTHPNYGIICIFCMCLLFGSLAFGKHIWFDEVCTITYLDFSYLDIFQKFSLETHPPGYFIGLKLFCSVFGNNLFVMHIFSLLPCIGMLLLGMFPIRNGFGDRVSKWFMFLCLTMPFMMWYSNEIRMYTWAIFLTTAAFVYAARIIQEGKIKNWILYFVFGILAAYTHYYALLGVAAIQVLLGIYLIIKERKEIVKWVVVSGLFIITYLPWLLVALKQISHVNEGFWITFHPSSWIDFVYGTLSLHSQIPHTTGAFCIIIAVLSIYLLYKLIRTKPKEKKELISFFALIVIIAVSLFTTLYSLLIQPIIMGRYIMIFAGIGIFFFAVMLPSIKRKNIVVAFAIVMILAAGVCYCGCFNDRYNTEQETVLSNIQKIANPGDIYIYDNPSPYGLGGNPYGLGTYYLRENEHYLVGDAKTTEKSRNAFEALLNGLPVTPDVIVDKLSSGKRVYLIESNNENPSSLLNETFSIKEIKSFDTPQNSLITKWTVYSVNLKE